MRLAAGKACRARASSSVFCIAISYHGEWSSCGLQGAVGYGVYVDPLRAEATIACPAWQSTARDDVIRMDEEALQ